MINTEGIIVPQDNWRYTVGVAYTDIVKTKEYNIMFNNEEIFGRARFLMS